MSDYVSTEAIYAALSSCGMQLCTDTRKIVKGSVFFALKGPSFDANEFAATALQQGCRYAVIDDATRMQEGTLLVKDVLTALQDVARMHRRAFTIPVLAITGSNAKTTTKELVHAVLSRKYKTLATQGNLNNHIGVPLTLLNLRPEHQFAIIEMGANHQGEIDLLCRIAEPGFGLITNIGKAHLEGFGGIEGVKRGKSELYRFLAPRGGIVFVNGDDDVLMELASSNKRFTYGQRDTNDIVARDYSGGGEVSFRFHTASETSDWNSFPEITTQLKGGYNFINCLAAACIGSYFGVTPDDVRIALAEYTPSMNRSQLHRTSRNEVILDAYNANPSSMVAAITNLADTPAKKKMAILGDMFELGSHSVDEHRVIGDTAASKRFEELILVGAEFAKTSPAGAKVFADVAACRVYLESMKPQGYLILLKGSRGMRMESLLDML